MTSHDLLSVHVRGSAEMDSGECAQNVGDAGPPALDAHESFVSGRVQQLSGELGLAGLGCQKGGLIHKVAQLCTTEARGLAGQDCCIDCAVPGLVLHPQDN